MVQEIGRFMKADGACETSRSLRYCLLYDPHPSIISSVHKVEGKKPLHLKDSILASYYHHEVRIHFPISLFVPQPSFGDDHVTHIFTKYQQSLNLRSSCKVFFWLILVNTVTRIIIVIREMALCVCQVKFSELTLDTFRMLQALEWEPSGSLFKARTDSSMGIGASGGIGVSEDISDPSLPPNPHKYILYRPTVQELLLVGLLFLNFPQKSILKAQGTLLLLVPLS